MTTRRNIVVTVLMPIAISATASDFCVSTVDEFNTAMGEVNQAVGPHHLMIVAGHYVVSNVGFGSNGALILEGGYSPACSDRAYGAQLTILEGDPLEDYPPSFHAFGGDLTVRDLTLQGFPGVFMWPQGMGASLYVSRVAIISRPLPPLGDVAMFPADGSISLENVVIDGTTSACALQASPAGVDAGISATYVTIRNRGSGDAACFSQYGHAGMINSIAQADAGRDVVADGQPINIVTSAYASLAGQLDPASSGNFAERVTFWNSQDDLLRDSLADVAQPARDSGSATPGVDRDVMGRPRTVGIATDRGAFEIQEGCDVLFMDGFELGSCAIRSGHSKHRSPSCGACP